MANRLISLLSELVSIPSGYPDEKKLGEYIFKYFKAKGFLVVKQKVSDGRYNVIVEKGNGPRTVSLYAHLDTIQDVEGWKTDPFILTSKGDKAYGLGAFDMKSGLAIAVQTFLDIDLQNTKLQLLFCVDEENISEGGFSLFNSGLVKNTDCFISLEPALQYGLAGIVTGRIGRAVFEIKLKRSSLHYIYYDPKLDLNICASEIVQQLKKLNKLQEKDRRQFVFIRGINSNAVGMSLPQEVSIELDSSILPPRTNEDMLSDIKNVLKEVMMRYPAEISYTVEFKKRTTPFLSGYEVDKKNPYLITLQKSVRKVLRKNAVAYFRSSVADENVFALSGKPVLCIGPEGGNAHGPNEWVSLSSMEKLRNILFDFLKEIDAS